jgi:hypothetical protein
VAFLATFELQKVHELTTVIRTAAFSPKHFIAIQRAVKGAPFHIDYPRRFASYVCDDYFVAALLRRDIHVLRLSKMKSEAELCFTAAIGIWIVLDCARFLSVGDASFALCFLADETSFTVCHGREAHDEAVADVGLVTFAAHATHIVDVDISASLDLAVSVTAGCILALAVLATIHPCRTV